MDEQDGADRIRKVFLRQEHIFIIEVNRLPVVAAVVTDDIELPSRPGVPSRHLIMHESFVGTRKMVNGSELVLTGNGRKTFDDDSAAGIGFDPAKQQSTDFSTTFRRRKTPRYFIVQPFDRAQMQVNGEFSLRHIPHGKRGATEPFIIMSSVEFFMVGFLHILKISPYRMRGTYGRA